MPFGAKEAAPATPARGESPAQAAVEVDFDQVYRLLIAPALTKAGCFPFRADQETGANDIRIDMFYELVTADVVVADISILNPNVFYELGVRHGVRPKGVLMIHGGWSRRPFDIAPDRSFNYDGKLFERAEDRRDDAWQKQLGAEVEKLAHTLGNALAVEEQTVGSPVYSHLPGLAPADWSNINTGRTRYLGRLFAHLQQKLQVARDRSRPGDVLTLAESAPTRQYRQRLLEEVARSLVGMHQFRAAQQVLGELLTLQPDHRGALTQLGLVLGRLHQLPEAQAHLESVRLRFRGDPEAQGILGRVYKDQWRAEWNQPAYADLAARQGRAVVVSAYAVDAIQCYDAACRRHLESYYAGINVITLVKLLEHLQTATGLDTPDPRIDDLADLVTVVRVAARAELARSGETDRPEKERRELATWSQATLGELELVAGTPEKALPYYQRAAFTPGVTYFQVDSMLGQVELLDGLGFRPAAVTAVKKLLQQRRSELQPRRLADRVVLGSGHLTDAPGRKTPRFPAAKEGPVSDRIAKQLADWHIGPGDLAICGGARGADLLFAEHCAARGAGVWLLLAFEEGKFLEQSVRLDGSDWEDRFYRLKQTAGVKISVLPDRLAAPPEEEQAFALTNLWMVNSALVEAKNLDQLYAILVWDELPTGDGPGGHVGLCPPDQTPGRPPGHHQPDQNQLSRSVSCGEPSGKRCVSR
jgi:hypothetical protein